MQMPGLLTKRGANKQRRPVSFWSIDLEHDRRDSLGNASSVIEGGEKIRGREGRDSRARLPETGIVPKRD